MHHALTVEVDKILEFQMQTHSRLCRARQKERRKYLEEVQKESGMELFI